MIFRMPVVWRDSIPPHEVITYIEPLPNHAGQTFKRAEKVRKKQGRQDELGI
jgi:hypothetical protein